MGHSFAGIFGLLSAFVTPFEAEQETGDNPVAIPSVLLGILGGVSSGLATTLVPKDPIKDSAINWINRVTLGFRLLNKMVFCGPAQSKFAASTGVMSILKVGDGRATGAIIDAILAIPALVCTAWHFNELSGESANSERSQAIVEETSNLTSYISREQYAIAVNMEDPASKVIPIGIMVGSQICYAGLQLGDALIK